MMTHTNLPSIRITPPRSLPLPQLRELWNYRDMVILFIWRDFQVRYKQTLLGRSWAFLAPFISMVIFSVFFGLLLGVPTDGTAYPIFSYSGLLGWEFFTRAVTTAGGSVINNAALVRKIYFPRLLLPISAVVSGLPDFLIALVIMLGMMLFFNYPPTLNLIWLLPLLLIAILFALGLGLWFAALSVLFRDASRVLGYGIQILLYATPVIYPSTLVTGNFAFLYRLNPMVGVVEGFRWALLGTGNPPGVEILPSIGLVLLLLIGGLLYFQRTDQYFTDVL